jgi:DNA primase
VAEYIHSELEQDDMPLRNPLYKYVLDEAAGHCGEEGFVASKYFLYHPQANVSKLATDLISDKYQLSKYHTKYHDIRQEEDMLMQFAARDLLGFKDACIQWQINEIGEHIKDLQQAGDMEQVMPLMKEQEELNEIKKNLNRMIGESIVLRM